MKPLPYLICAFMLIQNAFAQSPDYIAVRKKNGRTIKNFYSGSQIVLQTNDGNYLQGPIQTIRNDSLFILRYDVRLYQTTLGSIVRDTISVQTIAVSFKEIKHILLSTRKSFLQRTVGPLLMIGGAGYLALNVLNGTFFSSSVSDEKKIKTLGIGAGLFGIGYLISRLFSSDGFTTKKHRLVYVDL